MAIGAWAAPAAAEPPPPGSKAAPVLSGSEYDYPPFSVVRDDRQADGFAVQLLRAALKAMGRDVAFKPAPWAELKQDLAAGRLQVLPMVARTPERERVFDFTVPYLTMHGTIVVREGSEGIRGPADLKGKRVAVLEEDVAHEYLRRAGLGAIIVPLPSFATALRELSEGKHDAVVVQKLLAFQIMKQAGLQNLRAVGPPLAGYAQVLCFAVPKGDRALLGVLNEGLSIVMADGTFRRLSAEWFSSLEAFGRTKSRIVVGGDSEYPPYEFLDENGRPAGYNVDLTLAIARQMGLSVEIRLGSWARVRKGLEGGEIDLVHGMFYSADRDRAFDFSPPHTVIQHVIVSREGAPPMPDMQSLAGKSILVMSGDIMHDLAVGHGYAKQVVAVETQEEALRLLAAGKHDCALVAKVPALHLIDKNGWRNLVVSEQPVASPEYCYAVPKGKAELLSVFSEGLAAVTKTGEYRAIRTRWLGAYEGATVGIAEIARYVLFGAVPLGALLLGSLLWSRSLRVQVDRRTLELKRETETRSEYLAILSHELRNPLAPIRNGLYVLERAPRGSEQEARARAIVHRQVNQLAKLVDDLLDVTRISRGKVKLSRSRIDARDVARQACEDHRSIFEERGIDLRLDVPGAPVWIDADETRMSQVVGNLLQNAAKFTPDRRSASLSVIAVDGRAEVRVRDEGIGIEPELLGRVFEPFSQAERGLARTRGGLGLGLALVKGLVELHDGSVRASSPGPERGSEFVVSLPLVAGPATACGGDGAPRPSQPRVIVIIEDNADAAESLREVLELEGHRVHVATDGGAGIRTAREVKPDVVLCDVGLPDVSGYEVARMLRADGALRPITLVALSGYAQPEDRQRALEAGFDAHIAKPAALEALNRVVAGAPLRDRRDAARRAPP